MVNEKRIGEYDVKTRLYDSKQKEIETNKICEQNLLISFSNQDQNYCILIVLVILRANFKM